MVLTWPYLSILYLMNYDLFGKKKKGERLPKCCKGLLNDDDWRFSWMTWVGERFSHQKQQFLGCERQFSCLILSNVLNELFYWMMFLCPKLLDD